MLTQKEIQELRDLKKVTDDDNIRFKEIIKKRLYQNRKIIHCLNNHAIPEDSPDEYIGTNIRPYLFVPDTQSEPLNFICFKSEFDELVKFNDSIKKGRITFVILCESKDVDDKETGIARHDLLGSLIREEFHLKNVFGMTSTCISNKESTTDTNYTTRTLIFEVMGTNSLVHTEDGITSMIGG